ncbi:hypothetical protein AB0M47_01500 [Hamadaea sp. NPDC051192]|uniref:hypothetical protein n=1 Tax=Hamadaea sp. NPDC051192 TaxID=3154940 RepID=UPI003418AAE2
MTADSRPNAVSVQPDLLLGAAQELGLSSADIRQVHTDTESAPPSAIFGALVEAAELAQALADSVTIASTDLGTSAGRTEHIGGLLAAGSRAYADLDRNTAGMIDGGLAA